MDITDLLILTEGVVQLHNLPRFRNLLSLHSIAGSRRECSRTEGSRKEGSCTEGSRTEGSRTEGSRMEGLLRGKTRTHPDSLIHLFVFLVGMMP